MNTSSSDTSTAPSTLGTISRWIGEIPSTSMASISPSLLVS